MKGGSSREPTCLEQIGSAMSKGNLAHHHTCPAFCPRYYSHPVYSPEWYLCCRKPQPPFFPVKCNSGDGMLDESLYQMFTRRERNLPGDIPQVPAKGLPSISFAERLLT